MFHPALMCCWALCQCTDLGINYCGNTAQIARVRQDESKWNPNVLRHVLFKVVSESRYFRKQKMFSQILPKLNVTFNPVKMLTY